MSVGRYGNENLALITSCQYITFDGTSDSSTLQSNVQALTLFATEPCWVKIGKGAQTAAAPGAEKTVSDSFYVPADAFLDVAVPSSTDENPCVIAAIQDSAGGNLYIYSRVI